MAGRPLVFRTVVTLVRAGVTRVHVPSALRDILLPALDSSPAAQRAVAWIDVGTPVPDAALLIPITAPPPSPTLVLAAAATPTSVVEESMDRGAPVAVAPASLLSAVWPALSSGGPVGARLDDLLKAAAPARLRGEAGMRVIGPREARAAEDRLYASLGSVIDTALDTHLHRRLSRPVSRLAVARGVTPNQITVLSFIVGVIAAWSFALATPLAATIGLALYLMAVVLDHADGEVARLTLTESALGAWLDIVLDTAVHACVVLALGVASERLTGRGAAFGVLAALGVMVSAAEAWRWPATAAEDRVGRFLDDLGSRDGFYAMLLAFVAAVALAPGALPALMVLVAAGSHAYWVGRFLYRLVKTDRT